MAKRKARISHRSGYHGKRVGLGVEIYRHITTAGKPGFQACVELTRGKKIGFMAGRARTHACAEGRNPRVALGLALKEMGVKIMGRPGAFARYR